MAGTTRDVVEQTVQLGDIRLNLFDTAGVRGEEEADAIEAEGIRRSWKKLEEAGLVLAVFDAGAPVTQADMEIARRCQGRPALAIFNKQDLAADTRCFDENLLAPCFQSCIRLCAKDSASLTPLSEAVARLLGTANLDPKRRGADQPAGSWRRPPPPGDAVGEAIAAVDAGFGLDAAGVCIEDALRALSDLTGEDAAEAVIDEVFSTFCVGK